MSLPVIRLHYVHQEACYVVRRVNGMPLSVPVWMTNSDAARIEIIREPRLPLTALIELRRLTTTCLSLIASSVPEGGSDVAANEATKRIVRGQEVISGTATSTDSAAGSQTVAGALDGGIGQVNSCGGGK